MTRMRTMAESEIANALLATLISPNVVDSNFEDANIVDVVERLAVNIRHAGEDIRIGLELVAKAIRDKDI